MYQGGKEKDDHISSRLGNILSSLPRQEKYLTHWIIETPYFELTDLENSRNN